MILLFIVHFLWYKIRLLKFDCLVLAALPGAIVMVTTTVNTSQVFIWIMGSDAKQLLKAKSTTIIVEY